MITVCIPIAPHHTAQAARAIQSVANQTERCILLTMIDSERRGPGALRNQMLSRVDTPFVVFLDADDWIETTFAAECLAEYNRIGGDRYIFPDFFEDDGTVVQTPCLNGPDMHAVSVPDQRPYCGGTWHPITTLIPTEWARAVNGFDESLPGAEDTDFYLKLCTTFRCGHRLAKPLFHYQSGGGRAIAFRESADHARVMQGMTIKYGGKMGCCGDDTPAPPVGQKQPGDVMAIALWSGNRHEHSYVSNRTYERSGNGKTMWIDPRDAERRPDLWKVIEQQPAVLPVDVRRPMNLLGLANSALAMVRRPPQIGAPIEQSTIPIVIIEPEPPEVEVHPNIERIMRLSGQGQAFVTVTNSPAVHIRRDPTFVFPDTPYPSYIDIKRLVELSGYETTTFSMGAFGSQPYIVISPEPLPKWMLDKSNVIAWQLEYAGDYKHNYDGFMGQVWASDAFYARQNNIRYVLLGSHPDLAGARELSRGFEFDLTMLGYMTPRRQTIKDLMGDLRWSPDYPGHGTEERNRILWSTRMMMHVHQHESAAYIAPQRFALAAAYRMPVISETCRDAGLLSDVILEIKYHDLDRAVRTWFDSKASSWGSMMHEYLCVEHTFRSCVEEALKD